MNARGVLYDYLNYDSRTLFKRFDATGVKIATSLRGTLNVRTDTDNGWSLEAMIPLRIYSNRRWQNAWA